MTPKKPDTKVASSEIKQNNLNEESDAFDLEEDSPPKTQAKEPTLQKEISWNEQQDVLQQIASEQTDRKQILDQLSEFDPSSNTTQ